jgi:hypothetical protein
MGPQVNARELNGDFGMTTLEKVEAICILSRFTVSGIAAKAAILYMTGTWV